MPDESGVEKVGLEYVSKYFDQFLKNTEQANSKVKQLASGLLQLAAGNVSGAASTAVSMLAREMSTLWGKIRAIVFLIPVAGPFIASFGDLFIGLLKKVAPVGDAILGFAKKVLSAINPLNFIKDTLSRIFSIVGGILVADVFRAIGGGIQTMARDAFDAASNFQMLKIRMEGLLARDIIDGAGELRKKFGETADGALKYGVALKGLMAEKVRLIRLTDTYQENLKKAIKLYGANSDSAKFYTKQLLGTQQGLTDVNRQLSILGTVGADGVLSFNDAVAMTQDEVRDVFVWIRKLAVTSPFTIEDITNTFTLAKAYGIGTEETKKIVSATMEFAAAMGLTGDHIQRIIENFGQMIQQGKITGTEIRDLARGSFVPVTELFAEMGEAAGMSAQQVRSFASRNTISAFKKIAAAMGMTTAEMTKLADEGKLSVELFMQAFTDVVKRDFPDAGKRMSKTFATLVSNIKDFTEAFLGWEILGPVLNKVTGKISEVLEILLNDTRLEKLSTFFGGFISSMFDDFLNFDPQRIVDTIMGWANAVKLFLTRDDLGIDTWEQQLQRLGIPKSVTDSLDSLLASWNNIKQWWAENGDTIKNIIFEAFGGTLDKNALPNFTGGLRDFTQYMLDHGDEINEKIRNFLDPIKHFIEETWPLFTGDKKITDIVDPTLMDRIVTFFHDAAFDIEWLLELISGSSSIEFKFNINQGLWKDFKRIMDTAIALIQHILDLINIATGSNYSIPGSVTGGGGSKSNGAKSQTGSSVTSGQGTTTNATTINVNVAANYSKGQSSANVAMDVNAALAALS